jgi:DNA-binding transcriptional regulator YdaS (Cro superfamily)
MRLSKYLDKNHLTPEQFAAKIGVHMTTVYRLLSGATLPKRTTITAIRDATGGLVTAADLAEESEPQKPLKAAG